MGPRPKGCRLAEEPADLLVGFMPALPEVLLVFEVRTLLEPRLRNCPSPGLFPRGEPAFPDRRVDAFRSLFREPGHGCRKRLLDPQAMLLIDPRRFDRN